MIKFTESKRIFIYSQTVDMRMGLNKIQILVALNFNRIERAHSVFVFCSRRKDCIKMYYEDDYGAWLLQERLFDTKFKWPEGIESGRSISQQELNGLCKGLQVIESLPKKRSGDKELI